MMYHSFLLVVATLTACVTSQSQCPSEVFRRSADQSNQWLGEIILRTEFTLSGLWVRLEFDKKVQLLGSTFDAKISTTDNISYLISNPDFILDPSVTVTIPFFVRFSELEIAPEVRAILLNGRPLCPTTSAASVGKVSPCPSVFLFDEKEESDRWYGNLTLRSDVELRGLWVRVMLDAPAQLIGSKFGSIKASDNQQFLIIDKEYILKPGVLMNIPFFVKYSLLDSIPAVQSVYLNARLICGTIVQNSNTLPSNRTSVGISTDIDSLSTGTANAAPFSENSATVLENLPPDDTDDVLDSGPLITRPVNTQKLILPKFRCGVTEINDRIFFGTPTTIEKFPWHGAIYHSLEYACGMSLVSPLHAVSAAHCFYNTFKQPVDTTSINLYFGLSHLRGLRSSGVQRVKIAELFKHDKYEYHTPRYDIAVIKFDKPVTFNSKIQPICLWQEDPDLKTVENKAGVVVGFGLTEVGTRSEQLLWGRILVVDSDTCRELNPAFYVNLSRWSYCAGNLTRSSVCRGDSGGGMFFKKPGTEIWQLRGITSTSKPRGLTCDTTHYAIFTDVARYKDWVEEQMRK